MVPRVPGVTKGGKDCLAKTVYREMTGPQALKVRLGFRCAYVTQLQLAMPAYGCPFLQLDTVESMTTQLFWSSSAGFSHGLCNISHKNLQLLMHGHLSWGLICDSCILQEALQLLSCCPAAVQTPPKDQLLPPKP